MHSLAPGEINVNSYHAVLADRTGATYCFSKQLLHYALGWAVPGSSLSPSENLTRVTILMLAVAEWEQIFYIIPEILIIAQPRVYSENPHDTHLRQTKAMVFRDSHCIQHISL